MLSFSRIWQNTKKFTFPLSQQQAYLEDIAALIEDGISANLAIDMMAKITHGTAAQLTHELQIAISKGGLIADGLRGWYPEHIVEMIRAGQEGGSLTQALRAASRALGDRSKAVTTLLAALTYPIVVVCMGLGVMVFLNHSIFSDFQTMVPVATWPLHAKIMVHMADWLEHWWWGLLILMAVLLTGVILLLRHYVGQFRKSIDNLPFVRLYRQFIAARFMSTLGLLIANGLVLKNALKVLKNAATPYMHAHLITMEQRLSAGYDTIGEVLDTGLLDAPDILRLRLIVKDNRFEQALLRLGQQASARCQKQLILSGRVGGALFLFVSAGLALFMILSVYDVGSLLSKSI